MDLNPIEQLDVLVTVGAVLIVIVTYFVLRHVFVLPYLAVMDAREQLFETADECARESAQISSDADAQATETLTRARESAETMITEARRRADSSRRESVASATEAASGRLESGRTALAEVHRAELEQSRAQAVECVTAACGRLLPDVDGAAVEGAVDRLMTRRMT